MSQPLLYADFRWLDDREIQNLNIENVAKDASIGYILVVDIEYPRPLHDKHNDLPLLAEQMVPPNAKFKNTKSIPNSIDKTKYVCS